MGTLAYRKLYKNHGKSIGYWEGWVEAWTDETKVILQYARVDGGKVTRREYQAQQKNVGRTNMTTCLEQAQLELDSRTKKQMDKGYVTSKDEALLPSTNTLGFTKPMLAQPLEKVKTESINWNTTYAQPKLDGHRAMFKNGVLYSRQGKVIDLPHIIEAIDLAGLDDLHLDGELYLHGKTLQEISSLIKRKQEGTEKLVYHIYDVVGPSSYSERTAVFDFFLPTPSLALVPTTRVENSTDLEYFHEENLAAGYEGTMLRWGNQGYEDGKRSKHLLKLKNFQDDEFRIIDVKQGKPTLTLQGTFQVPVWVCCTPAGDLFTCTAQGDLYQKHRLWQTKEQHINKLLTVKYHGLSKDGIPQLPVALRFKEEI